MASADPTVGLTPAVGTNPLKQTGENLESGPRKGLHLEFLQHQQDPLGFIWHSPHHSCPYDAFFSI